MIRNTKQNWTVGQTVKVGFMSLVVRGAITTPGDSLPDVYFLTNLAGTKCYEFTPHNGCRAVSLEEVQHRVSQFRIALEQNAAAQVAVAIQRATAAAKFNEFFAVAS